MSDWGYPTGYGRFDFSTDVSMALTATNTKTAWTQVYASTPFDVSGLTMQFLSDGYATNSYLIDIGVGGAGSEVVIVPNLLLGYYGGSSGNFGAHTSPFFLPIAIPASTRVAVRCQQSASETTQTPFITLELLAQPFTGYGSLSRITDYGTNTGTSLGTTLVATASSNGAFAQLTASTANDIKGLILMHAPATSTVTTGFTLNVAVGAAAAEKIIMSARSVWRAGAKDVCALPCIPFWPCRIPAGTRLSASIDYTGATIQNTTVAVYGVD